MHAHEHELAYLLIQTAEYVLPVLFNNWIST